MKKVYRLEELDCANCAAKVEAAIRKLPGVVNAEVNFIMQKLTLEAAEDVFSEVAAEVKKTIRKIEPDCEMKG